MRIKNKAQFIAGIFNILISIIGLITLIVQHRIKGFSFSLLALVFCFAYGIDNILNSIETKAQRQKRKEELQVMAKMLGWDKDGDAE